MSQAPTRKLTVALAGNPNSGKTTIYNALTGGRQHVGNYPGVTVETKSGRARHGDVELAIVDLPGTYSLTAYSAEEVVARNFIIDARPDVVVDIIDSSNLERNLYLATQLLELGVPLVLAFNMSDLAESRGFNIDRRLLSSLLGVPIVRTVADKGDGIDGLLAAVVATADDHQATVEAQRRPVYGTELEPHVRQLTELITETCRLPGHARWFAIKLLEGDRETIRRLRAECPEHVDDLAAEAKALRRHIQQVCGDAAEIIFADRRYGFISGACTEAVKQSVEARHARSDQIDKVVTNHIFGLPLFLLLTLLVFQLTFSLGNPLTDYLTAGKDHVARLVWQLWPEGSDSLLRSLLVDGVIEGVGTVVVFVPLIFLLFGAIALLEDSGYMARAAFVMDRLMHKIGLHGKSFIPMLIGFGCTVPAILATRTLESRRDRLTTMLILPLFSCSARLPIYLLILGAFFKRRPVFSIFGVVTVTNQALWLMLIYLIGVAVAVVAAKVLRKTLFRGEVTPFVMELPPYRLPTLRGALVHTWERTWMFLRKAGTLILAAVIILWALSTFPRSGDDPALAAQAARAEEPRRVDDLQAQHRLANSAIGRIGRVIAPVMRPCGFDWKISTSLIGAVAAKEVFVSQMGVMYAVGADADERSTSLQAQLRASYTPLQGFCIMLFALLTMPCAATMIATWREGSLKWALFQVFALTAIAWTLTTAVYQIGSALGLGASV